MTLSEAIFLICFAWNFFGLAILFMIESNPASPTYWCRDELYMHYWWIRDHYHYNRLGTVAMCVLFNVICPIATICHWFYYGICKLFTI